MVDGIVVGGLTFAGAGCELVGVSLILKEIAGDRALAREIAVDHEPTQPAPTPDEPIQRRGPLSRFLGIDWDAIAQVNNQQLRDALSEATNRLIEADLQRDRVLREFLEKQLQGRITTRVVGIVFFVAGIVLSATGQLLQVADG